MPPFAGNRNPCAMGINHGCDTEAGAGTQNDLGSVGLRRPRSDLFERIALEARKGQGLGLEVVEHDHLLEVELFDELQRLDDPICIRQGDAFARDRPGSGNDRRAWQERAVIQKAVLSGFGKSWMGIGRDAGDRLCRTMGIAHHREARVRSTDVGDEHGETQMAWGAFWEMCVRRCHDALVSTSGVCDVERRPARRALRRRISAVDRFSAMGTL